MTEAVEPVQKSFSEFAKALEELAKKSGRSSPAVLSMYDEVTTWLTSLTDELITGIMPAAYRELEKLLLESFGDVTDEVYDMPDGSLQLTITATNSTGLKINYDVALWLQGVLYRFLKGCAEDISGVRLLVYDTDGKQNISVEVGFSGE